MLEDLKSRQHKIEAERDRCRTACHLSDVQASREVIQEGIEKATMECKKVKTRLAQIEDVNAEIIESIEVRQILFILMFVPFVLCCNGGIGFHRVVMVSGDLAGASAAMT